MYIKDSVSRYQSHKSDLKRISQALGVNKLPKRERLIIIIVRMTMENWKPGFTLFDYF